MEHISGTGLSAPGEAVKFSQLRAIKALECAHTGEDDRSTAVSDLLQSSQYLDMFNDSARNRAYNLAIQQTVKPGDALSNQISPRPLKPIKNSELLWRSALPTPLYLCRHS